MISNLHGIHFWCHHLFFIFFSTLYFKDDKARYTDWSQRDDIKAELKVDLIILLAENGYPPVDRDEVYKEIFEQAENFKKYQGKIIWVEQHFLVTLLSPTRSSASSPCCISFAIKPMGGSFAEANQHQHDRHLNEDSHNSC